VAIPHYALKCNAMHSGASHGTNKYKVLFVIIKEELGTVPV